MARAAIFTLDPSRGGVPALARVVFELLKKMGHEPRLVYRGSEDVPVGSRLAMARYFLTTPPVRRTSRQGMEATVVADYPVPVHWQYHLLRLVPTEVAAPVAAAVSGSSHVALPLAIARRSFVLWVATRYADELHGRAEAGDLWAKALLHHPLWETLERQEGLVYERASIILGLSPSTSASISTRWPQVASKLRTVIYPVDIDRFCPGTAPADSPYVLLTARIRDPRKNVDLLLRAFARTQVEFPNWQLRISGDPPLPQTLSLVHELNIGDAVSFLGYVDPEAYPALYQSASLFVLPSLQEGLGISVLEAMACGLPVICTRCGGVAEVIRDGTSGTLVPNNDEEALAEAMLLHMRHPERRRALGAAARQQTLIEFSKAIVESQLRDAFRHVYPALF